MGRDAFEHAPKRLRLLETVFVDFYSLGACMCGERVGGVVPG